MTVCFMEFDNDGTATNHDGHSATNYDHDDHNHDGHKA